MTKMTVDQYFTGKEDRVANKYLKSCPASFVCRNMHIEMKGLVRLIQRVYLKLISLIESLIPKYYHTNYFPVQRKIHNYTFQGSDNSLLIQ